MGTASRQCAFAVLATLFLVGATATVAEARGGGHGGHGGHRGGHHHAHHAGHHARHAAHHWGRHGHYHVHAGYRHGYGRHYGWRRGWGGWWNAPYYYGPSYSDWTVLAPWYLQDDGDSDVTVPVPGTVTAEKPANPPSVRTNPMRNPNRVRGNS